MFNTKINAYKFLQDLKKLDFVQEIILFGSRARQDHKERSDIDIAILSPGITDKQWHVILDIIDNADTLLSIDCIRLDTLADENPLKKAIKEEGIVVYRKGIS